MEFMQDSEQSWKIFANIASIPYQYNPRKLVFQHGKTNLYHYSAKKKNHQPPILIVFSTINRPEVLDLFPEQSFVNGLTNQGYDVYLLDWGYPDAGDFLLGMSDYLYELNACSTFIRNKHPKFNLLGICQGGVLALCYASLSDCIQKLILISTPINFHTRNNVISRILAKVNVRHINKNVPGEALTQFFISLRPFNLVGQKYWRFFKNRDNNDYIERFLRIEKWLHDSPDQTNASFKEFITQYYQQNKLIKNRIFLQGKCIRLSNVNIPILNLMGRNDHIVPPSSSLPLKKYVSSKVTQRYFDAGHIGIYLNAKHCTQITGLIAKWLAL